MKSDRKKRILAAILCMVMVLSSNISALAEGEVYADPDAVTQMETPEAVSETQPESAPQEPAAEEPPVSTEQIAPEAPAENNEPAAPEAPAENNEPAAPEAPAENNEPAAPETPAENNEPAAPETPAENNEPAAPETPEAPEEEAPVFSEETELTKELRDASGKLVQKVTAKLPKGAFEAETSQIEMEVTYVDSSMENYIKGMMEKKLPTDNTLGDYFLYNIQFKVNGEAKESLEPITITFEKSNLEIKDTKKANVFFFDPANPEVSGDKDELVEITQRSELLESLQAAGQSTATMEEDYDLSSIEIKEENRSGKIVLEGRKSTIYGSYVEKEPEQKEETPEEQPEEKPADIPVLNYEDDKVTVSVTAEEAGIIPEGAELKVLPITSEDTETKEQYQEVEKKIQEKVAEEEKEVVGFLAYDITFVDKDGNEMEPNGKVKVSMNYKKAELPPEVVEKKATDAEVTVLHLEEDENGEVKQVVDMGVEQKANVDTLTTTEGAKVQNVEVETESFSVFTITWNTYSKLEIHIIDSSGSSIGRNMEIEASDITGISTQAGIDIEEIAKKYAISGYMFGYAVVKDENITSADDLANATKIKKIRKTNYTKYYYSNEWKKLNSKKIYFVYNRESMVYFVSGTNGQDIQPPQTLESFFSSVTTDTTENLAPRIEGYRFVKTVVADQYNEYENKENDGSCWALRLRKNSDGYQYNRARSDVADNHTWDKIEKPIYFIYKEDKGQIATRDSSSDGISLNVFNYDKSISEEASGAGFPFYNGATNNVDGRGTPNTGGDVRPILKNGYPVSQNGKSLDFLFQTNESTQANYLFQYDEETRCYEYNSLNNHAYYDKEQKRFRVYDYTLSPSHSGYVDFNVGNFLPFNDVIHPSHGKLNYVQKENRTHVDYWFGMTMGLKFYQPKDGKIENEPMKFEFSGDDDVFVYLDGVLILDLGGIHSAQTGSIDFSTGTVIQNKNTTLKIYDLYKNSGLFTEEELNEKFKPIWVNGKKCQIFKDDSVTQMDFFYLERGAGASNCHIKFNMPTIPTNTIIVGKEIENANAVEYSDVEFSFKLELQEDTQNYHTLTNTTVEVRDRTGKLIDPKRTVDENGIFKLRHGEQAYFKGYPITTRYRVTEVGVNSHEYDKITIEGVHIDQIKEDGQETTIQSWRTDELQVSETPRVIFRNRIDSELNTEFRINKILNAEEDKEFQIQVYFGNSITNPNNEAYAGEYYIDQTKYVATDGIIKLKAGKTAVIMRLPSGTSFKVQEVDPNTGSTVTLYKDPTYQIKYLPRTGNETSGEITKDSASGTTILGDTEVTVTNTKINTPPPTEPETYDDVPHHKYIDYLGDDGSNTQTALKGPEYYRLYLDVKGIPNEEPEPADIVLVLNRSNSMKENFSNSNRWDYVKRAARTAVNTLLPTSGLVTGNRLGIVWFSGKATTSQYSTNIDLTSDKTALLNNIESTEYNYNRNKYDTYGTNYQAAFWEAQKVLEKGSNNKKFVIFVTDGEPTVYHYGTKDNPGNVNTKNESSVVKKSQEKAIEAAKLFSKLNGFYGVSVGDNNGYSFLNTSVKDNVAATVRDTLRANNEVELTNAFNKILGSITKQIGSVTITDELSPYVNFVNEYGMSLNDSSFLTGNQTTASQIGLKVNISDYDSLTYDTHEHIVGAEEYTGDYTYEIDLSKKTVKVNFGEDYFLVKDKIYTISFNVMLTDAATEEALEQSKEVGDVKTDYPRNETSSGKKGFFANTKAELEYKRVVNGQDSPEKKGYEKPVVQPYPKADWQIKKVNKGGTLPLSGATFTLTKSSGLSYTGTSESDGIVKWTSSEGTELTSSADIEKGTYILEETVAPQGYVLSSEKWTVAIGAKGMKPVIKLEGQENEVELKPNGAILELQIENTANYELPSTGGTGIFVYTIGGTLLLMAAALLIYKMKREEVLKG